MAVFIGSKTLQFKVTNCYFIVFWNVIYFCDGKAECSAVITPVSHDPSEIIQMCWFGVQDAYLQHIKQHNYFFYIDNIINVKNCLCCLIYLWNYTFMNRKYKCIYCHFLSI